MNQNFRSIMLLYQGQTNGCGTAALAMALNGLTMLKTGNLNLQPFTQAQLDAGNRELDCFSAPGMLMRVARRHQFFAQLYHHQSFEQIQKHLEEGHLPVALISIDRALPWGGLHYVVITDIQGSTSTAERTITFLDPARRKSVTMLYCEFEAQHWNHLKFGILPVFLNRAMIVLSAQGDLESGAFWFPGFIVTAVNSLISATGYMHRRLTRK